MSTNNSTRDKKAKEGEREREESYARTGEMREGEIERERERTTGREMLATVNCLS